MYALYNNLNSSVPTLLKFLFMSLITDMALLDAFTHWRLGFERNPIHDPLFNVYHDFNCTRRT